MFNTSFKLIALSLILSSSGQVKSNIENDLCPLRTDQVIEHYGYEAEEHHVTTADGYILTIFRCNSKQYAMKKRKPLIIQHGLPSSSDDFTTNIPSQAIAYVLADAGFDVWLPNFRGTVYSRRHVSKNPDTPGSGFWNFSWYELGIYDQPAVIDYILNQTHNRKLYYIGYSEGTTSIMVLLSEKPEYNAKIYAASLMAPVGYTSSIFTAADYVSLPFFPRLPLFLLEKWLNILENTEILPRSLSQVASVLCAQLPALCNGVLNFLFGASENQRNATMLPVLMCRSISGGSANQYLHYLQEYNYGYFGKYKRGFKVPPDFDLSRINTPISLHYSTADTLATATDVQKLIPKLQKNIVRIQVINEKLNHIDFVWGVNSASLIYSEIIKVFQRFN
ncbi:lipase 3-like [Sitodiplosis mosellana]|uniref:lipase 3-like n=1 Tax=Sitodiplosis mosellana TaxID=263140 RepID=UPI0024446E02|nr:lipase 3-like [Sitodiplosis mosellana]